MRVLAVLVPLVLLLPTSAAAPVAVTDAEDDVVFNSVLVGPLGQEVRGQPSDDVWAAACSAPHLDLLSASAEQVPGAIVFRGEVADLEGRVTCAGVAGVAAWTDPGAEDSYAVVTVGIGGDGAFAAHLVIDSVTGQVHPVATYSRDAFGVYIFDVQFVREGSAFTMTVPTSGMGLDFHLDPTPYTVAPGDYGLGAGSYYETRGPLDGSVGSQRLTVGDGAPLGTFVLL